MASAALSLATGMMVAIALMVGSFRETVRIWVDQTVQSDLWLRPAKGLSNADVAVFPASIGDEVPRLPFVRGVDRVRGRTVLYGDTIIKIIGFDTPPELSGPGGMMAGVTGFRYVTFAVDDVAAMQKKFEDAGYNVAVPAFEFRPGLFIAIVEDPDGNWVEFVPADAGA